MGDDEQDVPELAERIVRADEEHQRKRPSERRRWWGGPDRARRARTDPSAAPEPAKAPIPWRTYIAIGAAIMVVVLLVISLLND